MGQLTSNVVDAAVRDDGGAGRVQHGLQASHVVAAGGYDLGLLQRERVGNGAPGGARGDEHICRAELAI